MLYGFYRLLLPELLLSGLAGAACEAALGDAAAAGFASPCADALGTAFLEAADPLFTDATLAGFFADGVLPFPLP